MKEEVFSDCENMLPQQAKTTEQSETVLVVTIVVFFVAVLWDIHFGIIYL